MGRSKRCGIKKRKKWHMMITDERVEEKKSEKRESKEIRKIKKKKGN